MEKKNKTGVLTLPDFKTYKAVIIETVFCWRKDGHAEQRNRVENLKANPHPCGPMVQTKMLIQWHRIVFSVNGAGIRWICTWSKANPD